MLRCTPRISWDVIQNLTRWNFNGFMNVLLSIFPWWIRNINSSGLSQIFWNEVCYRFIIHLPGDEYRKDAGTGSFHAHQFPPACRLERQATQCGGFKRMLQVSLFPWQQVKMAHIHTHTQSDQEPLISATTKLIFFFYFLQIYNLLYKWSNKQICYKETLVRSNNPMMILLCILYVMLCVRLLFFLSVVL
jgi:hypothetical protein